MHPHFEQTLAAEAARGERAVVQRPVGLVGHGNGLHRRAAHIEHPEHYPLGADAYRKSRVFVVSAREDLAVREQQRRAYPKA